MLLVAVDCRTSFLRMSRIPNAASLWMSESTLATSTPSAMTTEGVITDGTAREEIDGQDPRSSKARSTRRAQNEGRRWTVGRSAEQTLDDARPPLR